MESNPRSIQEIAIDGLEWDETYIWYDYRPFRFDINVLFPLQTLQQGSEVSRDG